MNFIKLHRGSFSKLTSLLNLSKYSTLIPNQTVNSKKLEEKIKKKIQFYIQNELPDKELEIEAELVRKLKNNPNSTQDEINQAVQDLTKHQFFFRQKIEKYLEVEQNLKTDSKHFELLLKERFFYDQSFTLYGGVSGLYDLGPLGCALQNNLLSQWQNHFILRDSVFQVDCSILTPEQVLKASGHLSKFSDIMVRDLKTNESYRVDHLLKSEIEKILKKSKDQELRQVLTMIENSQLIDLNKIDEVIQKFHVKSPKNNPLSAASPFNLMFKTEIGSHGNVGYMRPETAQGIFLNFKRLYDFNQKKLPLIVAQIGKSFRNEISPKSGLIRQREFLMAEIEHFVDPVQKNSNYKKFNRVENLCVNILDEHCQLNSKFLQKIKLREAIDKKIIKSEIIAYYIGRINEFCIKVGINEEKIRFRQHLCNEMAHYANECWDLECLTSYGWIECAGIADRSDFDLKMHSEFSGIDLKADRINKIENTKEQFLPHVIEPSFGIGRIMYTILEHNYKTRSNSTKKFLSLPYQIAPFKCSILPLNESDEKLKPFVQIISDLLIENDDISGTIGRRYWRSDECGIPYVITVDYDTLNDRTITVRDRDTTEQVRIKIDDIPIVLSELGENKKSWKEFKELR
ncbi:glycine--tRNA ligase [Brachionus plicatilis]|uniref:glycine--tRNA ligase n=1 Tax=Brachionus plicatilis TaxID=10195 RepID=A0A3M7QLN9_BRAPC|nr:glycine--tRNA ligase [Brachionus plicatilis]